MTGSEKSTQDSDMGDAFVRLDFVWETRITGRFNRVAGGVKTGALENDIYHVVAELRDDAVHIGVVTTMESVTEADIDAFERECEREIRTHLDGGDNIGEYDVLHVSAVYLGDADGARPIRSTHPTVQLTVTEEAQSLGMTGEDLEKHVRKTFNKRVDVHVTETTFQLFFREPTVTEETVRRIKEFSTQRIDVEKESISTVFMTQ